MLRGLAALTLALLALAGCGSNDEATTPPPAASEGALTGTTLDGETVSVADFRGTPVFVNVWSSW